MAKGHPIAPAPQGAERAYAQGAVAGARAELALGKHAVVLVYREALDGALAAAGARGTAVCGKGPIVVQARRAVAWAAIGFGPERDAIARGKGDRLDYWRGVVLHDAARDAEPELEPCRTRVPFRGRADATPASGLPAEIAAGKGVPTHRGPIGCGAGCKTPGGLLDGKRTVPSPEGKGLGRGDPAAGRQSRRDKHRKGLRVLAHAELAGKLGDLALAVGCAERALAHAERTGCGRRAARRSLRAAEHRARSVRL